MPKEWIDWSDLMQGKVGEPEAPQSRPVEGRGPIDQMERPPMPSDEEIRQAILAGAPKQPTDEQLFGHLVVPKEVAEAAEKKWDNTFNSFYEQVKQPVESQHPDKEWGCRGPISKETMTEEEMRISQIPVSESMEDQ